MVIKCATPTSVSALYINMPNATPVQAPWAHETMISHQISTISMQIHNQQTKGQTIISGNFPLNPSLARCVPSGFMESPSEAECSVIDDWEKFSRWITILRCQLGTHLIMASCVAPPIRLSLPTRTLLTGRLRSGHQH